MDEIVGEISQFGEEVRKHSLREGELGHLQDAFFPNRQIQHTIAIAKSETSQFELEPE